jgi:hypothetical protein
VESTVKYHSSEVRFLTRAVKPVCGQCQVGGLTGAVASKRVTEAREGHLTLVGNQCSSVKAQGGLTVRLTSRAGTKVGLSDLAVCEWKRRHLTDKRYSGDNRLILPKSSHRRQGLAPRCRLIASWGWSRSQGYGCSPFKAVRELGSERRETVRSLSATGVGWLRGAALSTRGPERTNLWCTSYPAKGKCWVAMFGWDNR